MQPPIQPNPYAPPEAAISFAAHEPQRYEFAAEVLESDVHRATRRLTGFVVGFCFLSGALFCSVLSILVSLRPMNLPVVIFFTAAALLFLFALLRITWRNLGPGVGRLRVRATPLIVGDIHGTITDSEIRISAKQYTSLHPLRSCSYADVRGDSLVFAFDQRRLLLTVIPRRAFAAGCFERAAKLVMQHAVANKVSPTDGVVDRRLQSGEFYPIDLPTDGVHFSGSITSRDVLASPLRSQNTKVKWILIGAIALMALMPMILFVLFYDKLRLEIVLVLSAFFLVLILRLWSTYRKNLGWAKSPDQVLMRSQGVLTHHALHASTPAGASIYQWDIFTEATIQSDLLSLALPGKLGHRVLLARGQFASDNDWLKAQEIIREQACHFPVVNSN